MGNQYKYSETHLTGEAVKAPTSILSLLADIFKIRITVLVAFTTALGYILATDHFSLAFIYPVAGIFIMACGAAAINHYQERRSDKLMVRTMNRPIPSGALKERDVLLFGISTITAGSIILFEGTNLTTLLIGLTTFVWYNGIYTPLKKRSSIAIIPGSVVGALPPVAGWAAAGGNIADLNIIYIAFYFFLWQIPHFWLLLLKYGEDYKKAGFPVLTDKLERKKLISWIYYLTIATAASGGSIASLGIVNYSITNVLLLAASAGLCYTAYAFYRSPGDNKEAIKTFIAINIYTVLLITFLSVDKLIKLI